MKIKEAELGESIYNFIERIIRENDQSEAKLPVKFNDIEFSVFHDSNIIDIVTIYLLKTTIRKMESAAI